MPYTPMLARPVAVISTAVLLGTQPILAGAVSCVAVSVSLAV